MTVRATLATAGRVLTGMRHDPRTVALLVLVPAVLLTLFRYVFDGRTTTFSAIGLPLLGLFPLISMFVVTSITMLRERTGGTLERLMTLPMSKLDLLAGYAAAFTVLAVAQMSVISVVAFPLLGLAVAAPVWMVIVIAVLNALVGMAFGLFVSAFAATEFQAVQFLPALLLPQLLLCGLFAPRNQMSPLLQWVSDVLPLTYAFDALDAARTASGWTEQITRDALILAGVLIACLVLGAASLRRRTP